MRAEIQKIKINGTTLAYEEYGSGDRYLISTQSFFFEGCHAALLGQEYGYHVFLVYMRGSGESEHIYDSIPRDYVKIWGEDIIAFAEVMGIKRFYYTGVSHGNFAGWYIAFHRPELLRAFVPASGITRYKFKEPFTPVKPMGEDELDQIVGNREALDRMAWTERDDVTDPERIARRKALHEQHLEILMHRKKEEFLLNNTGMSGSDAASEEEYEKQLKDFTFPLLIINGAKDFLSKPEEALYIAKLVPDAKLLIYQNLGHGGPDEYPEIIAGECDRFFKES